MAQPIASSSSVQPSRASINFTILSFIILIAVLGGMSIGYFVLNKSQKSEQASLITKSSDTTASIVNASSAGFPQLVPQADDTEQIKKAACTAIPQFVTANFPPDTQVSDINIDVSKSSVTEATALVSFIIHWESGVRCSLRVQLRKYDSGWKGEGYEKAGLERLKADGADWVEDSNGKPHYKPGNKDY